MENASNALYVAALVLLGVLLLSLGVFMFSMYANYSEEMYEKISDNQNNQFNAQFLKYYGSEKCTIHDIVSLANLAKQNNIENEIEEQKKYNKNTYYIQIDLKNKASNVRNLELANKDLISMIEENAVNDKNELKYYKCIECLVSDITKRVYYMKFEEI